METKPTFRILLDAYKVAANRTRNVFIILNIYTLLLLFGYFNHRWSWLRHIQQKEDFRFVNLSLTDTKIYIEDLPLLGGLALLVILIWFYYSRRRERGILKSIRDLVEKESEKGIVSEVYYDLNSSLVFNSIEDVDKNDKIFGTGVNNLLKLLIYLPVVILSVIVSHDFVETTIIPYDYTSLSKNYRQFVAEVELKRKVEVDSINNYIIGIGNKSYLIHRGKDTTLAYDTANGGMIEKGPLLNSYYIVDTSNIEVVPKGFYNKKIILLCYLIEEGRYGEVSEIFLRWIISIVLIIFNLRILTFYKRLMKEDEQFQKNIASKLQDLQDQA